MADVDVRCPLKIKRAMQSHVYNVGEAENFKRFSSLVKLWLRLPCIVALPFMSGGEGKSCLFPSVGVPLCDRLIDYHRQCHNKTDNLVSVKRYYRLLLQCCMRCWLVVSWLTTAVGPSFVCCPDQCFLTGEGEFPRGGIFGEIFWP